MNRREFVRAGVAASVAAQVSTSAQGAPKKRMNILYVFSDQQRACSMPGKPYSDVVAPTLDAFARQNTIMENCISNYPLCMPYRAILMSGRWPQQQNGVVRNGPDIGLKPTEYGLGQCFAEAGYRAAYVGKWHLALGGEKEFVPKGPNRFGFEYFRIWGNTNNHWHDFTWDPETGRRFVVDKWNATGMTDDAIAFLEQKQEKPWLLVVSWNPPHPPYDPPKEDAELYKPQSLKMRPNVSLKRSDGTRTKRSQLQSDEAIREAHKNYYGGITGVDHEFKRLLDTLEKTGQADNTIVIFTSDHGDMMGTHARMAKQVPWEESCHVPFFIRVPGVKGGSSSKELFQSIDIYPTLCGLAGIAVPKSCAGHDRSAVLMGRGGKTTDHVILLNNVGEDGMEAAEVPTYRGVRTATHTYAVLEDGRWLLYDNVADPYQMNNLAADPKHAALMKELDGKILAWQKECGDTFPYAAAAPRLSSYPT